MSNPIQGFDDATSLALHFDHVLGFAMPPVIPLKTVVTVGRGADLEADADLQNRLKSGLNALASVNYKTPVRLRLLDSAASAFELPVDPIISLSGKNLITRRFVSKSSLHGSIKERWGRDDWDITISGVLIGRDEIEVNNMTKELVDLCENGKKGLDLTCELLNTYFGINQIVIESFDFPFTKGSENQLFSIKAYSDAVYSLLELE